MSKWQRMWIVIAAERNSWRRKALERKSPPNGHTFRMQRFFLSRKKKKLKKRLTITRQKCWQRVVVQTNFKFMVQVKWRRRCYDLLCSVLIFSQEFLEYLAIIKNQLAVIKSIVIVSDCWYFYKEQNIILVKFYDTIRYDTSTYCELWYDIRFLLAIWLLDSFWPFISYTFQFDLIGHSLLLCVW